jgi:hypothetical protein
MRTYPPDDLPGADQQTRPLAADDVDADASGKELVATCSPKFNLARPGGRRLEPLADHADGMKVTVTMEIYTVIRARVEAATRMLSAYRPRLVHRGSLRSVMSECACSTPPSSSGARRTAS